MMPDRPAEAPDQTTLEDLESRWGSWQDYSPGEEDEPIENIVSDAFALIRAQAERLAGAEEERDAERLGFATAKRAYAIEGHLLEADLAAAREEQQQAKREAQIARDMVVEAEQARVAAVRNADQARAAAAELAGARESLRQMEWDSNTDARQCAWCMGHQSYGHHTGCPMAALLARLEAPP